MTRTGKNLPFGLEPEILGTVFDECSFEPVTAEEIREFADSVGDANPAYRGDDPMAPPTFAIRFRGARFSHPAIPSEALRRGFAGGNDFQLGAPIRPGDVITTTNVLRELYEKTGRTGTMVFVVTRQTMVNQRGEMVAVIDSPFMIRPETKP